MQDGDTALMLAAREGHSKVCDTLLEAKASPDLKNKVSALEMAQQRRGRCADWVFLGAARVHCVDDG